MLFQIDFLSSTSSSRKIISNADSNVPIPRIGESVMMPYKNGFFPEKVTGVTYDYDHQVITVNTSAN